MNRPRSRIISASAGSGKTYTLATHALGLLATDEDPASICAITFTRAAAGEILERICQRLVRAIEDNDAREDLSRSLGRRVSQTDAEVMLRRLLDALDRLNISTIDALLHRIASAFALSLDMPPGWSVLEPEQDDLLRERALEATLSAVGLDELATLIEDLVGKPTLSPPRKTVLNGLRDAAHRVRDVPDDEPWESFRPDLHPLSEAMLDVAIDALERMSLPVTREGRPHKVWQSGVQKLVASLRERRFDDAMQLGLVKKALEPWPTFARIEMSNEHLRVLAPILCHLQAIVMHRIFDRTIALRDLSRRYLACEDALKRQELKLRFDDIPPLLLRADAMGNLPELGERLDLRIRHLLLDEFQDTSIIQLRLLMPVLDEILSSDDERTCLIVGDAKQSLYTWRDAEPALLDAVGAQYPQLERASLDLSYRSSQVVLDTVNRVFGRIGSCNAMGTARDAAQAWQGRFSPHTAAKELAGRVRLIEVRNTGKENEDSVRKACVQRVREIRAGAPWASIGVIVRTNKAIRPIVDELRQQGIAASEEGGSTLCDTRPVACTVALLRLALYPHDSAARMLVGTSPLGPTVGLLDPLDHTQGARVASQVRARIARHGLVSWLAEIQRQLASSMVPEEHARFEQLIDLAGAFDAGTSPRLDAFLEMVDARRVELPSLHPVRVMTVHHAKGLEFDAVILCELDESIEPKGRGLIFERRKPLDPATGVIRTPTKDELPFCDKRLQRVYEDYRQRCIEEALCVLYVAMTRARHSLDMFIEYVSEEKSQSRAISHARILRETLGESQTTSEPSPADSCRVLHAAGDDSWMETACEEKDEVPEVREVEIHLRTRSMRPTVRLAVRAASRPAEISAPASILRPGGDTGARIGSIVHALFERVAWIEDFDDDEEELLRVARTISPAHAEAGVDLFRRAMSSKVLQELLARPSEACELWRERPFVVRIENPSPVLLSGRFDRVHIFLASGRPRRAIIFDFKTDREDEASLRKRYHEQMAGYRTALSQMLDLAPDRIRCTLVSIPAGTIIEMDDA